MSTSHVVKLITKHQPSSDGTSGQYEVNGDGLDVKDNRWGPEENMAKAKEMVKQYWKGIGRLLKAKRKATQTQV
jgi:hypothetical protein